MKKIFLLVVSFLLVFCSSADAKWWIFGKSSNDVTLKYVYINGYSSSDSDGQLVFFTNSLKDGLITVKGKASVGKGTIGAVEITTDNKETWNKAKLSDSGDFEYSFKPDFAKTYDVYIKAIDTAGKTNDLEDSHIKINFSDKDISSIIRDVLAKLFKNYEDENALEFMKNVGDKFIPSEDILGTAIRTDFNYFDYIKIAYYINSIVLAQDGKAIVSLRYERSVISSKNGANLTDSGITEMTFIAEGDTYKLYSMKFPLMFGLSDVSELAEGVINQDSTNPTLVLPSDGEAKLIPFNDAKKMDGSESEGDIDVGTTTLSSGVWHTFAGEDEAVIEFSGDDIYLVSHQLIKNLGPCGSVSSVSFPSSYEGESANVQANIGSCWAINYSNIGFGKAIIKTIRKTTDPITGDTDSVTVQYKYRP